MSYLSVFSLTRDPLLCQKIPCHLVALLDDNAIFNVWFQFGTILLGVSFTYQTPICMYDYQFNSLFGFRIEQQSFLETNKTLCKIHIALCNVSSMLTHKPQLLHQMHLGSMYNINTLPSLTIFEICLGQQFLTF